MVKVGVVNYRPLGKTGLTISEIGFGGWAIGGNAFGNSYGDTDDDVSRAALRAALDAGVTLFDTADIYGHGHSEALISEVVDHWDGEKPIVVTKGGVNFYRKDGTLEQDWTPYGVAHALQQSLYRLRRDTVDIWLLMNPPVREMQRWKVWETLEALRRAGKVTFYGVSVAEPEDAEWLLENRAPIDVIEVAYSLFYQGPSVRLFDMAERAGVGILVREPLANGFLAEKDHTRIFDEGDIRKNLPAEYVDAMRHVDDRLTFLSTGTGRTPAQAALRFALDEPQIASVVVGMKTPEQVTENVAAVDVAPISDDERRRISEAFHE